MESVKGCEFGVKYNFVFYFIAALISRRLPLVPKHHMW